MNPDSPSADDLDREAFYVEDANSNDEYELEPPDEEVLEIRRKHTEEALVAATQKAELDAVILGTQMGHKKESLDDWVQDFRKIFRFQIKHLLLATAALSVLLTITLLTGSLGATLVIVIVTLLGGALATISRKEKREEAELEELREKLYARQRRYRAESQKQGPDSRC